MFKVYLNDKEIEAIEGNLKHSENKASTLTFKLLPNSEFFTNIQRFLTKAKVFDDENEVFDGWVVEIEESMTNSGEFAYKVTCLSALDYLNCISTGKWDLHPEEYTPEEIPTSEKENLDPFEVFENVTVKKALEMALKKHNDNVTDDKKIFLGNVTVEDTVYMQSNRAKVLNLIQRIAEKKEAFIEIRKEEGKYYLDFLKEVQLEENEIVLGVNMTSISRGNTLENVITRIIPIGADGLTIKSVNNGKEYVDNEELKAIYGVNDTVITWDDVTIADNLKKKAIDALETINNETFSISTSAIDLSYINNAYVRFQKSQMVQIYNPVLKINEKYRIIEIDINLDTPYESSLTFSNAPCSTIETVNSMESSITETKTDYEKVNDKLIRKISKGDVETIVTQSAESWGLSINGKLKSAHYEFNEKGFVIGIEGKGDTAIHTNTYSKWLHSSGEYSEVNADGFFRNGRPYHNLMTAGYCITGGSSGAVPATATIQLPDEWKGKDFKVLASTVDTQGGEELEYMKRIQIEVHDIDTTNATFKLTASWTSIFNGTENDKELRSMYLVVGG